MFKPIIPVISDIYSHTFGEAIHLATIHAKYGSNHLDKSMAKTSDTKDQKNIAPTETSPVHINFPEFIYDFHLGKTALSNFFSRVYRLSTICLFMLVPPPKP